MKNADSIAILKKFASLLNCQKSSIDFEGEPAAMVAFRNKIENAIDLSKFNYAPAGFVVV